jgi:hypothetical protein
MRHAFSLESPGFRVPYTATAEGVSYSFTFSGQLAAAGQRLRLFHLRKAKSGPIRDTQLMEMVLSGNNRLVIETSGYGPAAQAKMKEDHPDFPDVIKGPNITPQTLAAGLRVTVTLSPERELRVAAGDHVLQGATWLAVAPGEALELVFGFPDAPEGADLLPPVGWTVETEEVAPPEPHKPPEEPVTSTPALAALEIEAIREHLNKLSALLGI